MALKTVRFFSGDKEEQRTQATAERNTDAAVRDLENRKQSAHVSQGALRENGTAKVGGFVPCDSRGGAFTVFLPKPSPSLATKTTIIKNVGGSVNQITVQVVGGLIDAGSAKNMTGVYEALEIYCDGEAYWTV